MRRCHDQRLEVCLRCRKAWQVSKTLPERRPGEYYICPECHRKGEGYFVRRK